MAIFVFGLEANPSVTDSNAYPMIIHLLLLVLGAAMILVGANWMTSGATALARRFGVSDFVIGLTLVAFGSSAPDLCVGIFSALKGHTQFALGNVVGSCIFDGILVVGCVALTRPFVASREVLVHQLPFLLIAYAIVWICANSVALDGLHTNIITRGDGLLMLLFYGLMLWRSLEHGAPGAKIPAPSPKPPQKWGRRKWLLVAAQVCGGLGALVWGGSLFVNGASGLALEAHISETVVGLTVVALGTSLPDLATSVVAAWRGRPGIAVGNVVGSCLFDALVVLGASALCCPLPMGGVTNISLLFMAGGAVLFGLFALLSPTRRLNRWEGALLAAIYACYVIFVVL